MDRAPGWQDRRTSDRAKMLTPHQIECGSRGHQMTPKTSKTDRCRECGYEAPAEQGADGRLLR